MAKSKQPDPMMTQPDGGGTAVMDAPVEAPECGTGPTAEECPPESEATAPVEEAQPEASANSGESKPSEPSRPAEQRYPEPPGWQGRLVKANEYRRNCAARVAEISEDLKAAKKDLEHAEEQISTIIDELKQPTLFAQPATEDLSTSGKAETSDAPAAEDESWKTTPLADLRRPNGDPIPAGTLKLLADHSTPILTIGDLTAHQQAHGEFWMKEIKGLGPKKTDAIAEACDRFWAERAPLAVRTTIDAPEHPLEVTADDGTPEALTVARQSLCEEIDKALDSAGVEASGLNAERLFRHVAKVEAGTESRIALAAGDAATLQKWEQAIFDLEPEKVRELCGIASNGRH
jgi:hypothetical protein